MMSKYFFEEIKKPLSRLENGFEFDPRTHRGCDSFNFESSMVSTHAPHTGCDDWAYVRFEPCGYFDPRTHIECDHYR